MLSAAVAKKSSSAKQVKGGGEVSRSSFSRTSFSTGRANRTNSADSDLNSILLIDARFARQVFSSCRKSLVPDYVKLRRNLEGRFPNASFVYSYYLDINGPVSVKTSLKQHQFKAPDLEEKMEQFACCHCKEIVESPSYSEIDTELSVCLTYALLAAEVQNVFLFAGSGDFVKAALRLVATEDKKLILIGTDDLSSPVLRAKAHNFLEVNLQTATLWSEAASKKPAPPPLVDDDFKERNFKSILKSPTKGDKPKRSVRFADDQESNQTQVAFPQTQETLDIAATLERVEAEPELKVRIKNNYSIPISKLAIKFNKNPLGLAPRSIQIDIEKPIRPGKKLTIHVPLEFDPDKETDGDDFAEDSVLEAALKTPREVMFFEAPYTPFVFFQEDNEFDKDEYLPTWKSYAEKEQEFKDLNIPIHSELEDLEFLQSKVEEINLHVVNISKTDKGSRLFCSLKLMDTVILAVLTIPPNSSKTLQLACRSTSGKLANIAGIGIRQFFQYIFSAAETADEVKGDGE